MACESENMESFHIFRQETIDGTYGDMTWPSISWKEGFMCGYNEGVNGGVLQLK